MFKFKILIETVITSTVQKEVKSFKQYKLMSFFLMHRTLIAEIQNPIID